MRYFPTPAAQDLAIKRLLVYLDQSTSIFSNGFIEELEGSDHEIMAAMSRGFLNISWIDRKDRLCLRVSEEGRKWVMAKRCKKPRRGHTHK